MDVLAGLDTLMRREAGEILRHSGERLDFHCAKIAHLSRLRRRRWGTRVVSVEKRVSPLRASRSGRNDTLLGIRLPSSQDTNMHGALGTALGPGWSDTGESDGALRAE